MDAENSVTATLARIDLTANRPMRALNAITTAFHANHTVSWASWMTRNATRTAIKVLYVPTMARTATAVAPSAIRTEALRDTRLPTQSRVDLPRSSIADTTPDRASPRPRTMVPALLTNMVMKRTVTCTASLTASQSI